MTKRNYNYIASVEKAVADKYGKNAAQDFRNGWDAKKEEAYLSQLKNLNPPQKSKSRRGSNNSHTERECPLCKTYSFSPKDDLYMIRFKCCYLCYDDFIRNEEARWSSGWRPSDEHLIEAQRRRK